ncbi:5-deoxy-glucuronate isomerase [Catenulispora yoronensis]|uniref:5-deoxy-glucuronate isomerase n=1 Tax=Catenulispora yoronensis TaxID=450799 RepID=A0ABP5FJS3_9ACTN
MTDHDITPETAGWHYAGLRTVTLAGPHHFTTAADEALILPLSGSCVVHCGPHTQTLTGRPDPLSGPTDFAYIPRDSTVTLIPTTTPSRLAIPTARAEALLPFRYSPCEAAPIETRGAGTATRTIRNLCVPETFETDRLMVVEVLTPGGNWSSWPPHKHDEHTESGETPKEEIYYYEGGPAYQRVYSSAAGEIDILREVGTGDVVLIPHGYHGPTMAMPGYDLYYLNVLAGPDRGPGRSMAYSDDPRHAWVRGTWGA